MAVKCHICLLTNTEVGNVNHLITEIFAFNQSEPDEKYENVQNINDMLSDLLLHDFSLDSRRSKVLICKSCKNTVLRYLKFKLKILRKRKTISRGTHIEVRKDVNIFLANSKEDVVALKQNESLLLVKVSKEISMRNHSSYEPSSKSEIQTLPMIQTKFDNSTEEQGDPLLVEMPERKARITKVPSKVEIFSVDDFGNLTKDEAMSLREFPVMRERRSKMKYSFSNDSIGRRLNETQLKMKTMSPKELKSLEDRILRANLGNSTYQCRSCQKTLNSEYSIRYHIVSKHFVPQDENKKWVREKIDEAKKYQKIITHSKKKWKCTECSKILNSEQALRAHLHRYLKYFDTESDISMKIEKKEKKTLTP